MNSLRKIIREQINKVLLICEVDIAIDDLKNRGFADQVGAMFEKAFADLNPLRISGKIGIKGVMSSNNDASEFLIDLASGDKVYVFRNTNPAFARIIINNAEPITINSQEMFSNNLPDLAKKYYLMSKENIIK